MSDALIDRLRAHGHLEAANEIERLRAALAEIMEAYERMSVGLHTAAEMFRLARAALEQKQ